jgi:uncharacterized membrane protein YhaH (DUF805 family)
MNDPGQLPESTPFPLYLFRFAGRLRPAQYFVGIATAFASLIAAFGLAASAMAPTGGGGGAVFAIPLFALFVWILVAVMLQRLRDAGRSPALAIAFILGPILLLFPGLELIEYAGIPMALMFVAILLAPGFMKPKPVHELAA